MVRKAIVGALLVMLTGLAIPGYRSLRLVRKEECARAQLTEVARAIHRFMDDTGTTPTRGRDGTPGRLMRLIGAGLIAEGSYYCTDDAQGYLEDHLVLNTPLGRGKGGYSGWRGPYLAAPLVDPWGYAIVAVVYPLARDDDRDCILVSAGPNGRMDGTYGSPRDVIAAGDDLVVVVVDKSPERRAPVR